MKRLPNAIELRDTRGRMLALMKIWDKALADLELAMAVKGQDREFQLVIADVYEQSGMAEQAKLHREQAEKLRPKEEKPDAAK